MLLRKSKSTLNNIQKCGIQLPPTKLQLIEEHAHVIWNIFPLKPITYNTGEEINWYNVEDLSIAEWQLVLVGMEKAEAFVHGTEVIRRGEIVNKVYYVETGELALDGISELGERFCIARISKNQLIGLESLLTNPNPFRSPVWVKAVSDVRIREVDRQALTNLFRTEMELFAKINKILCGQLAKLIKNQKAARELSSKPSQTFRESDTDSMCGGGTSEKKAC